MARLDRPAIAAAWLLLATIAIRAWDFGNPVIHVDEQYYLLVGDRLLRQGAVPYLDLWDRKPVGLFLLFAAIRLLPGDGILAYQLVASGFAWATAWIVWHGGRRIGASSSGALVAGTAYLLWTALLGGRGGQSPVFYNLPVAVAALLVLGLPALAAAQARRAILLRGAAACLLAGIAIQIKPTAGFEGIFIGLAHLWYLRRSGMGLAGMAPAALVLALAGALPTLAVAGWYLALGPQAFAAFWFANVESILLRPPYPADQLAMRLLGIFAQLAPLVAAGLLPSPGGQSAERRLVRLWMLAALIGFGAIGTFFDHYALPLVAPFAIAAAPALGERRRLAAGITAFAVLLLGIRASLRPDDAAGARAVARVVAVNSRGGCPYVFIGDTITYHLAGSCIPTAYAFPNLLAYTTEQGATGIDEAAEVRRILARRPPVIVTSTRRLGIWNRGSLAALKAALPGYRLVLSVPRERYRTRVYLRRDLPLRH